MHSYLRQSTASQSRLTPAFVDDTDFKTVKTGLTIANTDVKLSANGAASANKNSGGGTHRVNGMYSLTFDATDTATVGELGVSIVVSGALPVYMKFWVLEEAIYDALFAASAAGFDSNQRVDVGRVLGTAQTARDLGAQLDATVSSRSAFSSTATLPDSVPSDGTRPSAEQALYAIYQFLTERAVSGTTMTVKKPDGSTTLMTFTLNDAVSPTSITRSA